MVTATQAVLGGVALLSGVLAVFLGSPLTLWVFARVDPPGPRGGEGGLTTPGIHAAAGVLRGGRTIGLLERGAVYLTIVAGYPEGLVAVVALKGLGRFAELRTGTEGAAERFLIGSFTSLLCAGSFAVLARVALAGW